MRISRFIANRNRLRIYTENIVKDLIKVSLKTINVIFVLLTLSGIE